MFSALSNMLYSLVRCLLFDAFGFSHKFGFELPRIYAVCAVLYLVHAQMMWSHKLHKRNFCFPYDDDDDKLISRCKLCELNKRNV